MRIDKFLSEKYGSRTKAAAAISKGLVKVNGETVEPSYEYREERDKLSFFEADESYVSAGGYKLSEALKKFCFSVDGKIFADIGASTGGFTDCLLQNGAKKVYCIDVGESQLDKRLICDKTVVIDNFNARNLNKSLFSEKLDGIVIDVSFISLTYILKAVSDVLENGSHVLALIKPQFECESRSVGKNGIVKDKKLHEKIINKIFDYAMTCNLTPQNITNAPIIKGKNLEYVMLFEKSASLKIYKENLIKSVKL